MTESADDPKGTLPEFTKKLISLGLGAYFLTEEKIVGMVQGAKMPKEIGSSITSGASKAQKELMSFITREIASVIKKIDIQEEFQKALSQHKIKINAEIEFIPLGDAEKAPEDPGEAGDEEVENKRFNINTTIV
ncbi:MAG: hypothetical protein P1V97_29915, partial [Planctomycetota bacterium]|nr:hypothetical protein [Planctomycetota bacterium]